MEPGVFDAAQAAAFIAHTGAADSVRVRVWDERLVPAPLQQTTSTTSEDRVIRPDMKVTLTEGKFVYVDAKVPLSAFLDAQVTEDERDQAKEQIQEMTKKYETMAGDMAKKREDEVMEGG